MSAAMLPAVVGALSRVPAPVVATALAYVNRALGLTLSTVSAAISYVKANPGKSAIFVAGLVQAGVALRDILGKTFDGAASAPDTAQTVVELMKLEDKVRATLDKGADIQLSSQSNLAEELLLKDLIRYVESMTGLRGSSLREYHDRMRTFVELDSTTVARGVALFGRG